MAFALLGCLGASPQTVKRSLDALHGPVASSGVQLDKGGRGRVIPSVKLNNGVKLPALSFGTFRLNDTQTETMVGHALTSMSLPSIDTSPDYGNQEAVGRALAAAGTPRSRVFITSKVNPTLQFGDVHGNATAQMRMTLRQLRVSHVDLLLMHAPYYGDERCDLTVQLWQAMEDFLAWGLTRAIGVSNFCPYVLDRCLLPKAKVRPTVNQVKLHVGMGADPGGIKAYCASQNIVTHAYSVLGGHDDTNSIRDNEQLGAIGAQYDGHSASAVAMRWVWQQGTPFATDTSSAKHMDEALDIFRFELNASTMAALNHEHAFGAATGNYSIVCTH